MDEKQIESWKRVRAKGELRYASFWGGVVWGILPGVFGVICDFIFELFWNHFSLSFFTWEFLGRWCFIIAGFYLSGCVLGLLMWKSYERKFLEATRNDVQEHIQQVNQI